MRKSKRFVALTMAALAVPAMTLTLASSPLVLAASATTSTYGPAWGQFSANFPATPTHLTNSTEVGSAFPKGTATEAFYISSSKDPFSKNGASNVPTYIVVAAKVPSKNVTAFRKSMTFQDGKKISINGFKGEDLLDSGTLSSTSTKSGASKSTPTEVAIEVMRGQVAYIVVAVLGSRTKAVAFADSFRPTV
jgi:hypothetical protein